MENNTCIKFKKMLTDNLAKVGIGCLFIGATCALGGMTKCLCDGMDSVKNEEQCISGSNLVITGVKLMCAGYTTIALAATIEYITNPTIDIKIF